MRSLTLKLILTFVVICLAEAVLVAVLVHASTQRAFDRFIREEAMQRFMQEAAAYYEDYGTWDGIDGFFGAEGSAPPSGETEREAARREPSGRRRFWRFRGPGPFSLLDSSGTVVLPSEQHALGERLTVEQRAAGIPIVVGGVVRGVLLPPAQRLPLSPREEAYLARTDAALLVALAGALVAALLLGVWIARTYMRPLRALTDATHALARGQLVAQVPVRSRDELGTLTAAFNQMSAGLAEAVALRRQMTADIAHDLRTPLTVLSGYLEALRDGDLKPTPERFETMYAEARHLSRLVEDLRTLSLADAGELPLRRQPVAAASLLEQVQAAFTPRARAKHIDLRVETAEPLAPLLVDPDRLAQVLGNLAGNALRYTPEGGRIILAARPHEAGIALTVRDTGPGISPEALPHLFDRFYRGDKARQRQEGETGLGLSIAKSIVEAHGGSIHVASRVHEGTTFTVVLPAGDRARAHAEAG